MKTADALEFLSGWGEIMDLEARADALTADQPRALDEALEAAREVGLIAFKTASAARRLTELFDRAQPESEAEAQEFRELRAATSLLRRDAAATARKLRHA